MGEEGVRQLSDGMTFKLPALLVLPVSWEKSALAAGRLTAAFTLFNEPDQHGNEDYTEVIITTFVLSLLLSIRWGQTKKASKSSQEFVYLFLRTHCSQVRG